MNPKALVVTGMAVLTLLLIACSRGNEHQPPGTPMVATRTADQVRNDYFAEFQAEYEWCRAALDAKLPQTLDDVAALYQVAVDRVHIETWLHCVGFGFVNVAYKIDTGDAFRVDLRPHMIVVVPKNAAVAGEGECEIFQTSGPTYGGPEAVIYSGWIQAKEATIKIVKGEPMPTMPIRKTFTGDAGGLAATQTCRPPDRSSNKQWGGTARNGPSQKRTLVIFAHFNTYHKILSVFSVLG